MISKKLSKLKLKTNLPKKYFRILLKNHKKILKKPLKMIKMKMFKINKTN
jgi:hypothetical protein